MFTLIFRSILIYTIVLILFRLMGKRQLGQMQPFELVLTLILADIATIPMSDVTIPILHGIIPILTLMLVHYIITISCRKSLKISHLVSGKPIVIINQNGIDYKAVKKLNLSIEDITESLRTAGYFCLNEILFAIMETNGKISVLPKAEFSQVVNKDLKVKTEENTMPITLISEGKIIEENFNQTKITQNQLKNYIKTLKIPIKSILILTLDTNGVIYIQEKYKQNKIIQSNLKEEK